MRSFEQTQDAPEPTKVRDLLRSVTDRLDYVANLVEQMEDRIDGPQPRAANQIGMSGVANAPAPYVDLHTHAAQIDKAVESRGDRLANLLTRV